MKVKVSILIPVYNSEKYIVETIESCLMQTYENIEIVIVDDGSTDTSLEIAKSYQKTSKKVKVFEQTNCGAPIARNKAFSESSGDFVVFLDADDLLDKDKIMNQVKSLKNCEKGTISFGQFEPFYQTIEQIQFNLKSIHKNHDVPIDYLLNEEYFNDNSTLPLLWMIPRDLVQEIGGWRTHMIINQDMDFIYRIILHSKRIVFSENTYGYYRQDNEESISRSLNEKKALALIQSNLDIEDYLKKFENSLRVNRFFAKKYKFLMYYFSGKNENMLEKAYCEYKRHGVKKIYVGGKKFQLLNKIFPTKIALTIDNILKS